jgi:hypothetical protein
MQKITKPFGANRLLNWVKRKRTSQESLLCITYHCVEIRNNTTTKEKKGNILIKMHKFFGDPTSHTREGESLVMEGWNNQ